MIADKRSSNWRNPCANLHTLYKGEITGPSKEPKNFLKDILGDSRVNCGVLNLQLWETIKMEMFLEYHKSKQQWSK